MGWMHKIRKRRQARQDAAKQIENEELKAKEEAERRRAKEEIEQKFYDQMIAKKAAEKKRIRDDEYNLLRKQQAEELAKIDPKRYGIKAGIEPIEYEDEEEALDRVWEPGDPEIVAAFPESAGSFPQARVNMESDLLAYLESSQGFPAPSETVSDKEPDSALTFEPEPEAKVEEPEAKIVEPEPTPIEVLDPEVKVEEPESKPVEPIKPEAQLAVQLVEPEAKVADPEPTPIEAPKAAVKTENEPALDLSAADAVVKRPPEPKKSRPYIVDASAITDGTEEEELFVPTQPLATLEATASTQAEKPDADEEPETVTQDIKLDLEPETITQDMKIDLETDPVTQELKLDLFESDDEKK